jgi:hypothetical protein
MDSRWFIEDRVLPKDERQAAQAESEKALKNSTLFQRRLELILKGMIADSERSDEDFNDVNWQYKAAANIGKRKTLNEILKLIDLK